MKSDVRPHSHYASRQPATLSLNNLQVEAAPEVWLNPRKLGPEDLPWASEASTNIASGEETKRELKQSCSCSQDSPWGLDLEQDTAWVI